MAAAPLLFCLLRGDDVRMITRRPWFGAKRYIGWGWTPVSWQGWLVTAIFAAVVIAALRYFGKTKTALLVEMCAGVFYFVIILLTGAKPGGPGSKNELH